MVAFRACVEPHVTCDVHHFRFRFEDGKLSHDPFFLHIRLRRRRGAPRGTLALSLRVFICPENRVNEHRRWIEMDKFRCARVCVCVCVCVCVRVCVCVCVCVSACVSTHS